MRLLKTIMLSTCLLSSSLAFGAVLIDTQPENAASFTARDQKNVQNQIVNDIRAGVYDKSGIMWPVVVKGVHRKMPLSGTNFDRLTRQQQIVIVRDMVKYVATFANLSYRAVVNADSEKLDTQSIFARLHTNKSVLHGMLPAEKLLSTYAQKWAYKSSDFAGPNCWHTSVASIFPGWEKHRYMDPTEFACHIKNSFVELHPQSMSELEFGDLIRLANGNQEVHGFTFLGLDRKQPSDVIVFTKNGYAQNRYVFMTLETVRGIYSGTEISFFRPTRTPLDPATNSNTECHIVAGLRSPAERNPLVMAGYRRDRGRSLTPLTFN